VLERRGADHRVEPPVPERQRAQVGVHVGDPAPRVGLLLGLQRRDAERLGLRLKASEHLLVIEGRTGVQQPAEGTPRVEPRELDQPLVKPRPVALREPLARRDRPVELLRSERLLDQLRVSLGVAEHG
jgi:hypothetical protein